MKPWMMAMIRQRQRVSQTFTANDTWIAPSTTIRLESLTGKGQDGTPAVWTGNYYTVKRTIYTFGGAFVSESYEFVGTYPGHAPANYCDPQQPYTAIGIDAKQDCYINQDETAGNTDGANTTGFGYTFAGGIEVPATPSTYNNVTVTPNTSYPLVVPSGGSITITYYR